MSFVAVLLALMLEQARPLGRGNLVHAALRAWVRWCMRSFDAGRSVHGWLTWSFAVALPALLALTVYWLCEWLLGWFAGVLWTVAILYATLGFRQFSFHFTHIRNALADGDEDRARELLALWEQIDASQLARSDIVQHVVEHSVLAAHRHVFGVLAWFSVCAVLGLGPAGAVFYRLGEFVARYWGHGHLVRGHSASAALQQTAADAWALMDWLPVRLTAVAFAVVGSFEDAVDAWRNFVPRCAWDNDGIILAATAGAVNLPLRTAESGPESAAGSTAAAGFELQHLAVIVGLVWRTVVLWMLLLALLTLAHLLG